jgi:hypothetical protein
MSIYDAARPLVLISQKFGASGWPRLNVILYNRLSARKRVGLPRELQTARPKQLRFVRLDTALFRKLI